LDQTGSLVLGLSILTLLVVLLIALCIWHPKSSWSQDSVDFERFEKEESEHSENASEAERSQVELGASFEGIVAEPIKFAKNSK
jgi:hypothetical protein